MVWKESKILTLEWRLNITSKTKLGIEAHKRDRFQCVECGKTKGIEAHHIIAEIEELNNLVTLCRSCHKKAHNMAGCFKKGFDPRRQLDLKRWQNLKGDYIGHPFRGNQYTGGIKEV